jgi:hypothetical protein
MLKNTMRILALVTLLLVTSVLPATAQEMEIGETAVVVPAGGEARIDFEAYCLETGKVFPENLYTPADRAPDDVLRVLKAAILDDMVETDPLQTQLAIWYAVNGDWAYSADAVEHEEAQMLLDEAEDVQVVPLSAEGTSIPDAVDEGLISIGAENFESFEAEAELPDELPYRGRGTLVITNETDEAQTVFFPFGMVFESTEADEQDIVAYSLEQKMPETLPQAGGVPFLQIAGLTLALMTGSLMVLNGLRMKRARRSVRIRE